MNCDSWTLKIRRGSTLRIPVKVTDKQGVPIVFSDTAFVITPSTGAPVTYNPANSKLSLPSFLWRGAWAAATNYVTGDAVYRYVKDKASYWKALRSTVNDEPGLLASAADWAPFYQFLFLIPDTETASYTWSTGTYRWMILEGNNDRNYKTGSVEVTD